MSSSSPSPTRLSRSKWPLMAVFGIILVVVATFGAGLAFLFASWLDVAATANAGWRNVDQHLATVETLVSDLTIDVLSIEEATTVELVGRRLDAIESEILKIDALRSADSLEPVSSRAWVEALSSGNRSLGLAAIGVVEAQPGTDREGAVVELEVASENLRSDLRSLRSDVRRIESEDLSERQRMAGSVLGLATLGVICTLIVLLVLRFVARRSMQMEKTRVGLLGGQVNEDALTGLANRRGFNGLVSQAIDECANSDCAAAVLYVDLDGFKRVNDTLGHLVGDKLLIEVAGRALNNVRSTDTVARLGGDQFALLLRWSSGDFEPTAVAERIQSDLSRAFEIGEHNVEIGASVGVRGFGTQFESGAELISNADIAMYRSKLAESVQNAPYRIVYEPRYDADGSVVGAESQVRWLLSDGSEVLHEDLAPVAVELGLSSVINVDVLEQTAAALAQLNLTLKRPLWVSVLMDAEEAKSGTLDRRIVAALDATGLAPECLVVNITDRGASSRVKQMLGNIDKMKGLGVTVSMEALPSFTEQMASSIIDDARIASLGRLGGGVVSFDELSAIATEQQEAVKTGLSA